MVSINNLTFSYGKESVLDELSVDFKAGLVHGILGPNGSGKTTLLNVLAGNLPSYSGIVHFQGKALSYDELAYLKAEMRFYPLLTGREFLKIFQFRNPNFDINKWNELFDLPLNDLIETYSSGMRKKLGFMAILCQDRQVILLDEPFNNLDLDTNRLVARLLKMMAEKGRLVVLSSHILEILTSMTDYIHVLQDGQLQQTIAQDNFENWKDSYRAREMNELLDKAQKML